MANGGLSQHDAPPGGGGNADSLSQRIADSSVPTMAFNPDALVVAANGLMPALFGVRPQDLVGKSLRTLVEPRFLQPILRIHAAVFADGRSRTVRLMWRGHWIRVVHTRGTSEGGPVCVIKLDPWRNEVFDIANQTVECMGILPEHDLGDLSALTAREAEVMWMVGQGMSLPKLARALNRSTKTVETHVRAIGAKLKIRGRFEIARLAMERGITRMTHDELLSVFGERRSMVPVGVRH